MRQLALLLVVAVPALSLAKPLRTAHEGKSAGILVLDNCDQQYKDQLAYRDNLTLLDSVGKQQFRLTGFNNCESIGSSRMIATDLHRKRIWIIENVAHRIRRFDLAGKETLTIEGVHGSAIAVDRESGNLWALEGQGGIGRGSTVVYDENVKKVATHNLPGWDSVYDRKGKAFWIADRNLTKISSEGKVIFSAKISTWCASSLDVDPKTGAAWVAVREHPQVDGSSNRLLKFDADGKELAAIDLGQNMPFRVSVDPNDGAVWVAHMRQLVERFSRDGKSEARYPIPAIAVQADPVGGDVWVVTSSDVQRMSRNGDVTKRLMHASNTSQAWIAALE